MSALDFRGMREPISPAPSMGRVEEVTMHDVERPPPRMNVHSSSIPKECRAVKPDKTSKSTKIVVCYALLFCNLHGKAQQPLVYPHTGSNAAIARPYPKPADHCGPPPRFDDTVEGKDLLEIERPMVGFQKAECGYDFSVRSARDEVTRYVVQSIVRNISEVTGENRAPLAEQYVAFLRIGNFEDQLLRHPTPHTLLSPFAGIPGSIA